MLLLTKLAAVIAAVFKRKPEPSAFPYIYETDGPNKGRIRGKYRACGASSLHGEVRWYDEGTRCLYDEAGDLVWSSVPGELAPVIHLNSGRLYTLQWVAA